MKSILITGAASGIGAATVKKIATKNISFTLTTKSNLKALEEVCEYAKNKGANVNYICGDLSDKEFIKKLVT
jgi:3-oxoacyl-[acyl-carrier protein] reductase